MSVTRNLFPEATKQMKELQAYGERTEKNIADTMDRIHKRHDEFNAEVEAAQKRIAENLKVDDSIDAMIEENRRLLEELSKD